MKEGLGNGHWRIHDRIRMMPYRQILCWKRLENPEERGDEFIYSIWHSSRSQFISQRKENGFFRL